MVNRYAKGKRAYGECGKSGRRMLLNKMVEDGYTKLLVDPAWREPPLAGPPKHLTDAITLRRPAPDVDAANIGMAVYPGTIVDFTTGDPMRALAARYVLGTPTVSVT